MRNIQSSYYQASAAITDYCMQVTAHNMDREVIPVTNTFIEPAATTYQGSYVELPVMGDEITKVVVDFAPVTPNYYAALSEIEIFVGGKHAYSRFVLLLLLVNYVILSVSESEWYMS